MKKCLFFFLGTLCMFAQDLIPTFQGEMRAGYILHNAEPSTKAIGVGARLDMSVQSSYGIGGEVAFWTLHHFGLAAEDSDFYGENRDGLSFVGEAYLSYQNENISLRGGRLLFDSPHADSDDIRMIPNLFEGIVGRYDDGYSLTLAHLTKMAGWESGGDISKFKPLYEVMGVSKQNGMTLLGIQKDESALWLNHIADVANVMYVETSFNLQDLQMRLQLDIARDCGDQLMGTIHSETGGVFLEYVLDKFSITGALNKEFGDTGSMWSFGGGPYFTSLEDLTIDAVGTKDAIAYTLGVEYSGDITIGAVGGRFKDHDTFDAKELDIYIQKKIGDNLSIEGVYASIDSDLGYEDFDILRVNLRYRFRSGL